MPAIREPAESVIDSLDVIGEFRQGSFDNWYVDGLAFGDGPVVGQLRFDAEGRIVELAGPRASSARYSSRLLGALKSPTFDLEHDIITVRAAGDGALARVVIDNFQLIRYPIYGGLEIEIDTVAMQTYRFDVSMWKGREAYVEFLPGVFDNHHFIQDDSSYIEIEYAVAHAGDMPVESLMALSSEQVTMAEAVDAWESGDASVSHVERLNEALRSGKLSDQFDMEEWATRHKELESRLPISKVFMGMADGDGRDHPVFIRGSVQNPSEDPVLRRNLTVLDAEQAPFPREGTGRLEWAQGMADANNPLTARVMANRLWHHVFGKGIVETVDNFGVQGKLPTHPELLDYLAVRFVDQGWSVKKMVREMVLSEAFQRSTEASEDAQRIDPDNLWLQRYPVRRLEAESIRDAMLATSGRLDVALYGPSVPIHLSNFMKGRGRPQSSGPLDGNGRRSIYLEVRRNFLSPMMLVFDMPIPFTTFGRRNASNVPAQSLTMLNDPFVQEQAENWAEEIVSLKELSVEERVNQMYLRAFSRNATLEERSDAVAFLEKQATELELPATALLSDARPWTVYCHTIFNLKEFIYLL